MSNTAASVRGVDKSRRLSFAKDMILNGWDNLTVRQINFFSRYIRMFDK